MPLLAHTAKAGNLNSFICHPEPDFFGVGSYPGCQCSIVQFCHYPTICTDQELPLVIARGLAAANIGVQGFELVYQAGLLQEVQGSVYRRRGRTIMGFGQFSQQIVGLDWFVAGPDQLKNFASQGSKALSANRADFFGLKYRAVDTAGMVMILTNEVLDDNFFGHDRTCYKAVMAEAPAWQLGCIRFSAWL